MSVEQCVHEKSLDEVCVPCLWDSLIAESRQGFVIETGSWKPMRTMNNPHMNSSEGK